MSDEFEWGDELPTLSGDKLHLRWITHRDSPQILSVFGDPEVIEYWSSPALENLEAATKLIDQIHELSPDE